MADLTQAQQEYVDGVKEKLENAGDVGERGLRVDPMPDYPGIITVEIPSSADGPGQTVVVEADGSSRRVA